VGKGFEGGKKKEKLQNENLRGGGLTQTGGDSKLRVDVTKRESLVHIKTPEERTWFENIVDLNEGANTVQE